MPTSIYEKIILNAPIGYMILQCKNGVCEADSVEISEMNEFLNESILSGNFIKHSTIWESFDYTLASHLTSIINDTLHRREDIEGIVDYKGYSYRVKCIRFDESSLAVVLLKGQSNIELFMEAERMKLRLLDNIPGMAYRCTYDRDWTMKYVSEGCVELTGYRAEDIIDNKQISYNEIIFPEYREEVWNLWEKAVRNGKTFRMEYEILSKDGSSKWVYEQGNAIYNQERGIDALEGIIVDVTQQKDREKEINYLTYHDSMTGLYNRRYFGEVATRLVLEDTLPISVIIGDINGLKLINDAFGHELGDKLIKEAAEILKASVRSSDIVTRIGGDEFAIFLPQTSMETANAVLSRIEKGSLTFNEKNVDTPIKISISLGLSTMESRDASLEDTIRTAEDIMYKNKLFEHRSSHNSIMASIKDMLARRGEIKEENLSNLQSIARQFGEELGLKDDMIQQLIMLASIHDLGKVTIDAEILSKRGPLTDDEWTVLRKHPEMGYRIAIAYMELAAIADFILSHHERWDGTGYPSGLAGEDIPLLSRIISILDAYDAMTTGRPYRKSLPKEEAIKEIMENAGTQFDPRIAGVFVRLMSEADLIC